MQEITSKDNRIYKDATKLLKKKYRDELGLYLIEGINLVEEAFKCNQEIRTIFYKDGYDGPRFSVKNAFILSTKLFDELSQTEASQGVIAVVEKNVVDLNMFMNLKGANFLVLDRVQDPGNVGTIIRTADAAGYSLILLIKGTCDIYQPKVVRAATGSLFRIPVAYIEDNDALVSFAEKAKKKLVASALTASEYYYDVDLSEDIALILGNEGNGISEELIQKSDIRIKIPMEGNIDSLNCAISAGILLYERIRKCKRD